MADSLPNFFYIVLALLKVKAQYVIYTARGRLKSVEQWDLSLPLMLI